MVFLGHSLRLLTISRFVGCSDKDCLIKRPNPEIIFPKIVQYQGIRPSPMIKLRIKTYGRHCPDPQAVRPLKRGIFTSFGRQLSFILCFPILGVCSNVIAEPAVEAMGNADSWRQVWSDEFCVDGRPNPEHWVYEHGFVRNEELQWYQPDNAFCKDGLLIIEARREQVVNPRYIEGSDDWTRHRQHAEYTSACLKTRGRHSWTYGRIDVRARIDVRLGSWPAIWTLGDKKRWPDCGEVDIMEHYQYEGCGHVLANAAYATEKPYDPNWIMGRVPLEEFTRDNPRWADEFHVWRMDWDERSIKLFLDDRLMNEIDLSKTVNPDGFNPFHQSHYLLLNLAIGSNGGDPSETQFPCRFEVDYVRVYQRLNLTIRGET